MPARYRPPMEEDEASNRRGYKGSLRQKAAEANKYYLGEDIGRDAPQAIPGLYLGQGLTDVAKLAYFHGPKPVSKLSQKLSALAFGPEGEFNKDTLRPSQEQYRGLNEGVKHGFNERLTGKLIDFMAPRIAKSQNTNVGTVRDDLWKARDYGVNNYEPSLSERLEDFNTLTSGDLRQAKAEQASLQQAGLVSGNQPTPSGNIWSLTHPVEARKLLVDQLRHLNPKMKIPVPVPSNLRFER